MSHSTYKALDVANWFLAFSQSENYEIENLKLQKLLYFAQAHHLAEFGTPIFEEEIEAWVNGPAVRVVNSHLKAKMNEIVSLKEDFDFAIFEDEVNDFLITIWNTYGHMHRKHLRNKTHKEIPWTWYIDKTTKHPSRVIPQTVMQNYYLLREIVV